MLSFAILQALEDPSAAAAGELGPDLELGKLDKLVSQTNRGGKHSDVEKCIYVHGIIQNGKEK
jgi:hypothetical protein